MTLAVPPPSTDKAVTLPTGSDGGGISQAAAAHLLPFFDQVWVADFEYVATPGNCPRVVCLVAREAFTGQEISLWRDALLLLHHAPWDTGPRTATVAFFASAEMDVFHALGWPVPINILCLHAEFRCHTNGRPLPIPLGQKRRSANLLSASAYFGISTMTAIEKQSMIDLILTGGPWTPAERQAIIAYCREDVKATTRLLEAMAHIVAPNQRRLGHGVLRGRYTAAVAFMQHTGIPVDTNTFELLREGWTDIQDGLIAAVDQDYGCFEGRVFKADKFAEYLARAKIPWPRLDSGRLSLDDDTFRHMAKAYPVVSQLRELRHSLSGMRLNAIPVGVDDRNRVILSPFGSRTGRNQPSNSEFLFGTATWLRGLIKPGEGRAIAYLDYSSQELGIAAALSGDAALWAAYESGDPYMDFAIRVGAAPAGATKKTHPAARNLYKTVVLATQYGQSEYGLSNNSGMPIVQARQLLQQHHETYRTFWAWSNDHINRGLLGSTLSTPFGWQYRLAPGSVANPRSLLNWPMQASGSDMLRLACIDIAKAGISINAPIHDALMIEASIDEIDEAVEIAKAAMIRASALVLGGMSCRIDKQVIKYPHRYMDTDRGLAMWNKTMRLIGGPIYEPSAKG